MEESICIFWTKKSRCKSSPRMDLPLLICQYHLKLYYGLELGYVEIDDTTHVAFAGGFLKPIKGYSIFSRNEVIIPTKEFLDSTTVHHGSKKVDNPEKFSPYTLNKRIDEFIREYGTTFPDSMENRHVIEMYRNFIGNTQVDPGPDMDDYLPKLQAAVESRKTKSSVFIRNQPFKTKLHENILYIKNHDLTTTEERPIDSDKHYSLNFSYLLYNCLFSEMNISHDNEKYIDNLPPNVMYVDEVGLVATEQIADPMFLILDGRSVGDQMYYHTHVTLLQKQIHDTKYTLKDMPKQYVLHEAWKGGTLC